MNNFAQQRRRTTWWLVGLFGLLAAVAVYLVIFSFKQLRYEAFFSQRNLADAYVADTHRRISTWLAAETARDPAEYKYRPDGPLTLIKAPAGLPGLLHYFQLTADGSFSTPLLPEGPAQAQLSNAELAERQGLQDRLQSVLAMAEVVPPGEYFDAGSAGDHGKRPGKPGDAPDQDQLEYLEAIAGSPVLEEMAAAAPASPASTQKNQTVFSELSRPQRSRAESADNLVELKISKRAEVDAYASAQAPAPALQELSRDVDSGKDINPFAMTGQSPFRLTFLGTEYMALHRDVWTSGQRRIQGMVIQIDPFLQTLIRAPYANGLLSAHNDLTLTLQGKIIEQISASQGVVSYLSQTDVAGSELILQRRLTNPFDAFELIISAQHLPLGASYQVLTYTSAVLFLLMLAGFIFLKLLSNKSIDVAQQQQDFVAAVTHELKTPLTSIRMYGEILRNGWADEAKQKVYYDFIFFESERLSRLVNNVLQLARISRGTEHTTTPKEHNVGQLYKTILTQTNAQTEAAGYSLVNKFDPALADLDVLCDLDALQQVMMNLVDNAIKFSAANDPRVIICGSRRSKETIDLYVRDHGPGIPKDQMKKIFELFYRSEDERTRETLGTGIGLALVATLVEQMRGEIDVVNREPGAEFIVKLNVRGH